MQDATLSSVHPRVHTSHHHVVSREDTQRRLDLRMNAEPIEDTDTYTVADRFEFHVLTQGARPFLHYAEQRFSYAEVDRQANAYANALAARGVQPGDVCAIMLENRPAFYFSWLGLAKLGAVVAFINTQITGRILSHALETTGAKLILVGEECLGSLEAEAAADIPFLLLGDDEKPWAQALPSYLDSRFDAELAQASQQPVDRAGRAHLTALDTCILIFTSGTTGLPKAARYSNKRWLLAGNTMQPILEATAEDVFYCFLPLYHGAAATSLTSSALRSGASIALRRRFSSSQFWNDVRRYRVTIFQYIGEICRYLLNNPPSDLDRQHPVRCMMGAGLMEETWQKWVERFGPVSIIEGWGATEANTGLVNVDNRPGSCGRVPFWDKSNLRLVKYDLITDTYPKDAQGFCLLAQPGEVGEALGMITPFSRFDGYTNAAATQSKIRRNVFVEGDAYWSSGDLMRYDEDGYFFFVDRLGDTFRWKSENVSTQEVADSLIDCPGVEVVNIYGVQVPGHEGRCGMAALVMQPGCEFDPVGFYALTEERLPRYAAPVFVRINAVADMTGSFKLRKVDLQREGYSPELVKDPLYIRDEGRQCYSPYSEALLLSQGLAPFVAAEQ